MELQIRLGHDKIVARGLERYEIEFKKLRGGSNPNPNVRLTVCNRARNFEMRGDDRVVAPYLMIIDSCRAQPLIQQQPGPGSLFPIYNRHVGIDYVLDRTDRFGITRSNEQALFPSRKCDDLLVRTFQRPPEERKI